MTQRKPLVLIDGVISELPAGDAAFTTYEETIGDGTTTVFTITHNRNKRGVIVQLYEASGEYADKIPDIKRPTVNTITVSFEVAPDADQYTVVVMG